MEHFEVVGQGLTQNSLKVFYPIVHYLSGALWESCLV